jgi:hypothetical protein
MRSFAMIYSRLPASLVRLPAHAQAVARLTGTAPSPFSAWTEKKLFGLAKQVTR